MGRFTPQTTAVSGRSMVSLRAAKAQLPEGMSVKTIPGPVPRAPETAACRASGPHPSLLTARSASPSTPAICRTDCTSPSASEAWLTTSPTTGSLIILLQVLRRARHPVLEPLVEQAGSIDAGILQQVVHRHHFADDGDVLSRHQRHGHHGDGHAQDVHGPRVQPGAVVGGVLVPDLQLHHHLDALLLADGPHAEHGAHVD